MDDRNLTYQDLSEYFKKHGVTMSPESIKSWFRTNDNTRAMPDLEKASLLSNILQIPLPALLPLTNYRGDVKPIPITGEASCGLPITNSYQGVDVAYVNAIDYSKDYYAVVATGDSMSPEITSGDIVICNPKAQVLNGDLVHYILHDESAIKIYYRDKNDILQLIPINQEGCFFTTTIMPDNTELLSNLTYAKVIQIIKVETNNRKARLRAVGKE